MPKIKKLKRKKKFRANVNRKRLRNKLRKLPNIECKHIKDAWEVKQTTVQNLVQMGLAYDPNQVLKIPKIRNEMLKVVKDGEEEFESESENVEENVTKKLHVVQSLEEEAKHPRAKLFRLPTNEVHFATYMMDKYGEDYKAMVRDRKNYNQLTWRQIKAKIERFKRIPEQYAEYLVKKGEIVLEDPAPLKKLKPEILRETVEKKPNAKLSRRKRQKSSIVESIWQEESVIQNESMNDDSINATTDNDDDLSSTNQSNGEKKLQLFSDDEADDDDNNDVLMEEDDSASENESNIKGKLENEKKNVLLRKSRNSQQKNKKLRARSKKSKDKDKEPVKEDEEEKCESLLDMYLKTMKRKKKKLEKEAKELGLPTRKPFDRDIDLQVNRLDDARKKKIFEKASRLNDRFTAGKI